MKKVDSKILMLAMMVAALCSVACSSSDDEEVGGGSNKGQKTLKVDGESFYAVECMAEQTRNRGMYLDIMAANDPEFAVSGHELIVHISPSKVSELKEGDVFDTDQLSVQFFRRLNELSVNSYVWNELEGNITIKRITSMEMTIVINDLLLEHEVSGVKHTISGTAVLTSGTYDSKGNLLSFEDAIK